jgi:hypothetical protein
MTPRERVEAVLRGTGPDRVPFTVYEYKLPQCEVERKLRNDGLCIMNRGHPGYGTVTPNCKSTSLSYTDPTTGRPRVRTVVETPAGELSSLSEPAAFTSWRHELMFKSPEDYARLIAFVNDTQYIPDYASVERARAWLGDDVFLRGGVGYEPLQAIIYSYLGVETFAIEWSERRDEVMKLHDAIVAMNRRAYRVLAEGPHWVVQYGGNVSPEIVGLKRFEELIVPHYNELGEMLHKRGKMLLVHLDANCGPLREAIAGSEIDIVEAFTPAPDTDMSVADARQAWPDKVLWINFPSSVHLSSAEVIYETTRQIIADDTGGEKLIIGITEDVPEHRWQESFLTISRAIQDFGVYGRPGRVS